MDDPTLTVLVLLGLAAVAAGFVDAVVGGGGLIQLPALLLGLPNAAPMQILATNKLALDLRHDGQLGDVLPPDQARPAHLPADDGAGLRRARVAGALVASQIPREAFEPIVLVVLVVVGAYVLLKPELGEATALRYAGHRHLAAAMAVGFVIGFYDGALGPGTGSFFVFALVGLLGYSFLEASAKARLANWATNLGALVRLRAAGRGALEGRPGHGRLQPGRRVRRRAGRGLARRPVRPGVLHRRGLGVHRPDRRGRARASGDLASSP